MSPHSSDTHDSDRFNSDVLRHRETQESNAWLVAIVENSNDAIVSKTLDGIVTSWNRGAERLFGFSADEIVGRPITMIIPDDRLTEEVEILSQIRKGERIEHFETIRRAKDGELMDVSVTVSPVRDEAGAIHHSEISCFLRPKYSWPAATFLISSEAGYVTGSDYAVDGGEAQP